MILALPFAYRSLDVGVRAIDLRTLVDAARSLGAGWFTLIVRVILPNVRTAVLTAASLSIALVLAEVVIAGTLLYDTFPVELVNQAQENTGPRGRALRALAADHLAAPVRNHVPRQPRLARARREARMTAVAVHLERLTRRFGALTALDELDLDVEAGEMVALLGPSGCGKTTALRLLGGFDRPDGGRVIVGGRDVTNVPANRRDMGMVFQAYSLFPNMTRAAQRRVRAAHAQDARGEADARAPRRCSASSASATTPATTPTRCRAASSSASRSRARSRSSRACCCSTSRSPRWTRACAASCASRSAASSRSSASRRCSSPTTRPRRSRSPTASA